MEKTDKLDDNMKRQQAEMMKHFKELGLSDATVIQLIDDMQSGKINDQADLKGEIMKLMMVGAPTSEISKEEAKNPELT